jgi:hypothetical protein
MVCALIRARELFVSSVQNVQCPGSPTRESTAEAPRESATSEPGCAQPEAVVPEVSVTSTLPADWLPVQTMSTAQLIVQRTNLARFWLVSRIRARLLEIQVELDARLGDRP